MVLSQHIFLKENNVAIIFEEEGINTLEMSGELLLTILSSVAQQESETISSHVKLGLKMKSHASLSLEGCRHAHMLLLFNNEWVKENFKLLVPT